MAKQLSKLDAVNTMLRFVGNAPVNSLTSAGRLGEQAESILDMNTNVEQQRRWWFNTITDTLTPDINGEILLPANALEIDPDNRWDDRFSMLGGKLYNRKTDDFQFTADIDVQILYAFEFDEMPFALQYYIAMSSTRDLYSIRYPKSDIPRHIQEKYLRAEGDVNSQNIITANLNLRDNPSIAPGLRNRRG